MVKLDLTPIFIDCHAICISHIIYQKQKYATFQESMSLWAYINTQFGSEVREAPVLPGRISGQPRSQEIMKPANFESLPYYRYMLHLFSPEYVTPPRGEFKLH